jgi:hypothetical protein
MNTTTYRVLMVAALLAAAAGIWIGPTHSVPSVPAIGHTQPEPLNIGPDIFLRPGSTVPGPSIGPDISADHH